MYGQTIVSALFLFVISGRTGNLERFLISFGMTGAANCPE